MAQLTCGLGRKHQLTRPSRIGRLDRDRMRLWHRYRSDYLVGRGIDQRNTVFAVHRDEQKLAVRRQRDAVGLLAYLDRFGDAVARRVDDVQGRGPVARDIDRAAISADRHAMRAGSDWNGGDRTARGCVDDAHRIVGEVANIGLWPSVSAAGRHGEYGSGNGQAEYCREFLGHRGSLRFFEFGVANGRREIATALTHPRTRDPLRLFPKGTEKMRSYL